MAELKAQQTLYSVRGCQIQERKVEIKLSGEKTWTDMCHFNSSASGRWLRSTVQHDCPNWVPSDLNKSENPSAPQLGTLCSVQSWSWHFFSGGHFTLWHTCRCVMNLMGVLIGGHHRWHHFNDTLMIFSHLSLGLHPSISKSLVCFPSWT